MVVVVDGMESGRISAIRGNGNRSRSRSINVGRGCEAIDSLSTCTAGKGRLGDGMKQGDITVDNENNLYGEC